MITEISHITLIVKDLARTAMFLEKIFEAKEVYSSGNNTFSISEEKFFLINNTWICIMLGKPLSERSYNHIAFKIDDKEYDNYLVKIRELNLEIRPARPRIEGEGRSIYFYDFDNHLFELHTGTLSERLNKYKNTSE